MTEDIKTEEQVAVEAHPHSTETEALVSLMNYALGPMDSVFSWEDAGAILELIETLTKGGIIEVAIRNPNVMEYMRHWEGRAEKAEAALEAME